VLFSAATTAAAARSSISGFHFGGGLAALLGNHDADAVALDLQTIGLVKCVSRVPIESISFEMLKPWRWSLILKKYFTLD
jgi:hypothetical protein